MASARKRNAFRAFVLRLGIALTLGSTSLCAEPTTNAQAVPTMEEAAQAKEARDAEILDTGKDGFHIVKAESQVFVFSQDGQSGYQSQAGTQDGPGSERALIIQPSGLVTIGQGANIEHDVVMIADIVSAASANAVDVTSIASAVNEAGTIELGTRAKLGGNFLLHSYFGGHVEEPVRSMYFGLGLDRSFADDNATFGVSFGAIYDHLNNNLPNGRRTDRRKRLSYNINASFSQVLSPTTVLLVGYGFTHQRGTLFTTWNSVPLEGGLPGPATRGGELFPYERNRHAMSVEVAQHVPMTESTLRAAYSYYTDDFAVKAHTGEISYHQTLADRLSARAHFRYYTQDAVYFYGTSFPQTVPVRAFELLTTRQSPWNPPIFQTSDSDLAAFEASEAGGFLQWLSASGDRLDLSYSYYARTNGLTAHFWGLTYGYQF